MLEFFEWLQEAAEHMSNKKWMDAANLLLDALPEEGIENGDVPPEEAVECLEEYFDKLPKAALHGTRDYLYGILRHPKSDPHGIYFSKESFAMADVMELLWLMGSRRLKPIRIIPVIDGRAVMAWNVTFAGVMVYQCPELEGAEIYAIQSAHEEQKIEITAIFATLAKGD